MSNRIIKERKTLKKVLKVIVTIILVFASIISLYPLIWSIYSAFKTSTEILTSALALPKTFYYQNFVNAFIKAKMGVYFLNTIFITAFTLTLTVGFTVPTAYVLSRFTFLFRKTIKKIFVMGLFLQSTIYLVPLFLLMNTLNILDNRLALCFVYAAGSFPFTIYLLTGFMKGLARDYEDAAKIDGCGYFRTLIEIIVPMIKPAIVTIIIFNFLSTFNEFPMAFTMITTDAKKTLPIGLVNLMEIQRYATDWGALFAGLAIVTIPTILLYSFTQKKLTEGVSLGGLKG